jgi:hypothetical protein
MKMIACHSTEVLYIPTRYVYILNEVKLSGTLKDNFGNKISDTFKR